MSVVLITGSSGFVGRNLSKHLKNNQFDVIGLDYQADFPELNKENVTSWLSDSGLDGFIKYRLGSYEREEVKTSVLEKLQGVQVIVHLASQSHVDRSISSPKYFIDDNVGGTIELFEMARHLPNLEKIILFSTDETVACIEEGSAKEDSVFHCGSVYSASKGAQELIAQAYVKTHNLPIVTTRCVNIFGPHQHIEKLIPKIIWSAINEVKVPIYGSGSQTREWVHVDHVCDVINWLALNTITPDGKTLHICGTKEISNIVLAQLILGKLGKTDLFEYVGDRLGHDSRYSLHPGDAHLIWDMPKYPGNFIQDLDNTIDWYIKNLKKEVSWTSEV